MSKIRIKSTGITLLASGVQEYGDPIAIPKQKKIAMEDCHIDSQGYLVKRPGKAPFGPWVVPDTTIDYVPGFYGVHEYIDPNNNAHLLVKKGGDVVEILDNASSTVRDPKLEEFERVHFFTHRGRCRYNGNTIQRKITFETADRVGIDAPEDAPDVIVASGTNLPAGNYAWKFTFVIEDDDGNLLWESNPSPAREVTLAGDSDVTIICPASDDPRVNARYVYRTTAGGAIYKYAGRIVGNAASSEFIDDVTDAALGSVVEYTHFVPPTCSIAEGANERQFFIDGGKLRWSENAYTESYLEYVPPINFKELPKGGPGTGLKRLYNERTGRDDLLIFQERSFHILPGADPNQPIVTLAEDTGCAQQDTIVEYSGGVVFLTKDNAVVYYKGGALSDLTTKSIPSSIGQIVTPEECSATLLYGRFYALCARTDNAKFYNHRVFIFDLDTIQAIGNGNDLSYATCDTWFWNIDAQYLIQRRNGAVIAFDNNSGSMYSLSLDQIYDENLDGSKSEIVADFSLKYLTDGLYTRSQPITIRIKGRQTGTMELTPYFLDNYPQTGTPGHSIANVGLTAIAGVAVAGGAVVSQVQEHIETNFYNDKAGECFTIRFRKAGKDPFFRISAFELIYRTFSRV